MARIDEIMKGAELVSKSVGQPRQLLQLNYSDPGAGKTIFGAKLAKAVAGDGKVLLLDSHEGFVSLLEDQWSELRKGIVRVPVSNPADLAAFADAFLAKHPKTRPFTVVMLDELSAWVKVIAIDYVRSRTGASASDLVPTIEGSDWNPIGYIVADILGRFQRAGVHLIVNAHSREKGDRDGGSKKYAPNFTPLMNIDIQGLMHNVTLITSTIAGRGQYERAFFTRPSASVVAKTRVGGMPAQPTEKKLIELTAAWVRGEGDDVAPAKASAVVKGKTPDAPRVSIEDVPLPEDELDDEDKPVIVDETTTQQ